MSCMICYCYSDTRKNKTIENKTWKSQEDDVDIEANQMCELFERLKVKASRSSMVVSIFIAGINYMFS